MKVSWQSTADSGVRNEEGARESRARSPESTVRRLTEVNHGLSQASSRWSDFGLDLPVRDAPAFLLPAAAVLQKSQPVADGSSGAVESSTPGSRRSIDTPTVELAPKADANEFIKTPISRTASMLADPTISLTPQSSFIPVNVNRTSLSQWRTHDGTPTGTPLEGLPWIRDFDLNPIRDISAWNGQGAPPPGPPINDPQLRSMTATVTLNGHTLMGQIQISVVYADANNDGGGLIRLWRDQSKTTEIALTWNGSTTYSGSLFSAPSCTFYVEGLRPSKTPNDVKIKVKATFMMPGPGQNPPPPVEAEQTLTVTPVVKQFDVTPKQGGQVTFLRNNNGQIVGLNSGTQAANGGVPDGTDVTPNDWSGAGAVFFAVVEPRTETPGTPEFLQTIVVTNGNPSGVSVTGVGNRNQVRSDMQPFPIVDSGLLGTPVPFYPSIKAPNNNDMVQMTSRDSPAVAELPNFNNSTWGNLITRVDLTYAFRLHVVWQFPAPDLTIYSLARVDWQVVFRANTPMGGALTIDPASIITANPFVRWNGDPDRVIAPNYNTTWTWA